MTIRKKSCYFLLFLLLLNVSYSTQAQVFWQETFTDSIATLPSEWVTFDNNAGGGTWEITNIGPTGIYAAPDPAWQIQGTNNHWAMFDSATDCSGDQDTWLVTPAIDCSDKEEVWMRFDQYYLNFYCETYIRITTDEAAPLAEWVEIQLNEVSPNEEGVPEILMDISPYVALEETVYIGFEFRNVAGQSPEPALDGCAYNWQIDSLQLYDVNPTVLHDLASYNDFFGVAPYALWPVSQTENFGFLADVINNGQATQTGVEVTLEILDASNSNNVHTETLNLTDIGFPTIAENEIVENQLFPGAGFTPPEEERRYKGRYFISADSTDSFPQDNFREFEFEMTDAVFAKEEESTISISPNTALWPDQAPFSWSYGNHYHTPNGDGWFAHEVSFALGNPGTVAGKKVLAVLYEWEDIVIAQPTTIAPAQRNIIGFNEYPISGTEGDGELITIDLFDNVSSEKGVALKDGGNYLLMLSYAATDRTEPVAIAGSDQIDYAAQIYRSEQLGQPRYASVLMIGELENGTLSTIGFGRDIVPTIRMRITDDLTKVNQPLSEENKVNVFPSPAQNHIDVALELTEVQDEVTLSLINITGTRLGQHTLENVQTDSYRFDVSDLPAGSYFLNVSTVKGSRSVPFVIAR